MSAPAAALALRYLQLGMNPLPIAPGAHEPLVRWKYLQTTRTTEAEIRDWYRRWPCGVGIVCGQISNIVVLDSDPRNGPGLDLDYGSCPTVQTPGGGWHRYFAYSPIARSAHPLVPGLDVQSDKTYVIAPPSRRAGKIYTFVGNTARHLVQPPLVPAPIVERLLSHHASATPDRPWPDRTLPTNGSPAHGVDLDTALRLLEEVHGVRIKKVGPRQWMAGCPLHDDRTASLAVSVGDEGRLLLYCHAGCRFTDLVEHLASAAVAR